MIRAGVIGAGMVYGHYARAAAEVAEIALVAAYDPDPSALRTHDSLQRFLDEPLDAVLVLAPNAAHVPLVEACLDRGIPTLCEKPLALTAHDARALLDRAAARRTLLYTAMHARHRPEVRWLAGHLDAPVTRFAQTWLEDWRGAPPWYFRSALSGGGVLLDAGINHIDWIARHLPPLDVVTARAAWDGEVEHECDVEWSFDGGSGSTRLSWRGSPEERRSVVETRSGARFELLHDRNAVLHDGALHGPWRNDEYACVLREFARAVHDPASAPPSDAATLLALLERVYACIDSVPERRVS